MRVPSRMLPYVSSFLNRMRKMIIIRLSGASLAACFTIKSTARAIACGPSPRFGYSTQRGREASKKVIPNIWQAVTRLWNPFLKPHSMVETLRKKFHRTPTVADKLPGVGQNDSAVSTITASKRPQLRRLHARHSDATMEA